MKDEKKLIEEIHEEINNFIVIDTWTKGKQSGMKKAMILAEEQPKIGEWIPCSERLPLIDDNGESKLCLVTIKWWDGDVEYDIGWYNSNTNRWDCDSDNRNVIAWMQLPEPYKEDSK